MKSVVPNQVICPGGGPCPAYYSHLRTGGSIRGVITSKTLSRRHRKGLTGPAAR